MFNTKRNKRLADINDMFRWDGLKQSRAQAYLFKEFSDVNLQHDYIPLIGDELVDQVVSFFVGGSQLVYPAKSYFVAITYASFISFWSQYHSFYDVLSFKDLLPDDKYFTPYGVNSSTNQVYQKIASELINVLHEEHYATGNLCNPYGEFWRYFKSTEATLDYFFEEFLFEDEDRTAIKRTAFYVKEENV